MRWPARATGLRWTAYVLGLVLSGCAQHYPQQANGGMNVLGAVGRAAEQGSQLVGRPRSGRDESGGRAYGVDLSGVPLAEACQWAENVIAESACGVMDQIAVVLGDEGCVLPLVCQPCNPLPLVRLPPSVDLLGHRLGREPPGERHRIRGRPGRRLHGLQADLRSRGLCRCTLDESAAMPAGSIRAWNGYLANMAPSVYRTFEESLPLRNVRAAIPASRRRPRRSLHARLAPT